MVLLSAVVSQSLCHWQSHSPWSKICWQGWSLPKWSSALTTNYFLGQSRKGLRSGRLQPYLQYLDHKMTDSDKYSSLLRYKSS